MNKKLVKAATALTLSAAMTAGLAMNVMAEEKEPITITVYSPLPSIEEQYEAAAERYKEKTGNDVEFTLIYNESYKDKLKVSMAADSAPDIFAHWGGGPMISYIEEEQIIDLTDYMNEDGFADKWMQSSLDMGTYDGKIYALAAGGDMMVQPLFYNKDLFEKFNLEVPTTIEELEQVCDTFVENGIIPFALANLNKWPGSAYYMYLVDRIGKGSQAFIDAANRTDGGSFENEVFIKAGEKIQDWVEKGYFPEGCNGLDNSTGQDRQLLYTEQAAMFIYPTSVIAIINEEMPEFIDKVGITSFPVEESDTEGRNRVVGSAGSNFFSISSNCEHPQEAFEFLKELSSDETVDEMLEVGRCVPVEGILEKVDDPLRQEALNLLQDATYVQLAYDQYLSPELAECHKDTLQELYGLTITPEEAAATMEETASK